MPYKMLERKIDDFCCKYFSGDFEIYGSIKIKKTTAYLLAIAGIAALGFSRL